MINHFLRTGLVFGVPILAVTVMLMPTDAALAQKKKNKEPQTLSDMQLAESIVTLRTVKVTLEAANHDYGGHRAAAVRDVKQAIHQLHLALNHVKDGKVVPKNLLKDVKGGKEPQPLSDAQLAGTIPVLKQTHTLLQQANHDYGGHRAKAVTDLHAAIMQIEKALKFSRANNQE